jgi:uncharacterized protein YndB with AHSA1/START domain
MADENVFKITVTRQIAAAPEAVFDAWLDPVSARRWLFATPDGQMIKAEIDSCVGGEFCFVDRRGDEDIEHLGEYLEIDRPRRLAFMFTVNQSDDVSRVAVDFTPTVTAPKFNWSMKSTPSGRPSRNEPRVAGR